MAPSAAAMPLAQELRERSDLHLSERRTEEGPEGELHEAERVRDVPLVSSVEERLEDEQLAPIERVDRRPPPEPRVRLAHLGHAGRHPDPQPRPARRRGDPPRAREHIRTMADGETSELRSRSSFRQYEHRSSNERVKASDPPQEGVERRRCGLAGDQERGESQRGAQRGEHLRGIRGPDELQIRVRGEARRQSRRCDPGCRRAGSPTRGTRHQKSSGRVGFRCGHPRAIGWSRAGLPGSRGQPPKNLSSRARSPCTAQRCM